jgi:hypothetical protein
MRFDLLTWITDVAEQASVTSTFWEFATGKTTTSESTGSVVRANIASSIRSLKTESSNEHD